MLDKKPSEISDTVTVTADGRAVVDIRKLFAKKHVRDKMSRMRKVYSTTVRGREGDVAEECTCGKGRRTA